MLQLRCDTAKLKKKKYFKKEKTMSFKKDMAQDWFAAAAAAKSLQSCLTLCDPIDGSPPGPPTPRPWDSPGKNTGVGCHCLLQCMKVKSESEAAQWCPTLSDPMDCSLPGSSDHGIFPGKSTGVGCHCLLLGLVQRMTNRQGIFRTENTGTDPGIHENLSELALQTSGRKKNKIL